MNKPVSILKNDPSATEQKYKDQLTQIENDFYSFFPNGFIDVSITKMLNDDTLRIHLGLIGNHKDNNFGIVENDPMHHKLIGHFEANEKIELECLMAGLRCKPEKGSIYAFDRIKTAKRKQTTTLDKHVVALKKWFNKLAELVKENKDRIEVNNPKYLEVN